MPIRFTKPQIEDEYGDVWEKTADECGTHPGQALYVDTVDPDHPMQCPVCASPDTFGGWEDLEPPAQPEVT